MEQQSKGNGAGQLIVLSGRALTFPELRRVEWDHWLAVGSYKAEELALLSLDLDPRSEGVFKPGLEGLEETLNQIGIRNTHRIRDRLRIVQGRLGEIGIRLSPFLALARELAWDLPSDLARAREKGNDIAKEPGSKEWKSVLRIVRTLAAMADVDLKQPFGIAPAIVAKAKEIGLSISERNVGDILKRARDLQPDD